MNVAMKIAVMSFVYSVFGLASGFLVCVGLVILYVEVMQ